MAETAHRLRQERERTYLVIKAMVKELEGEGGNVAERLATHGISPIEFAIVLMGGQTAAAEKIGMTRQGLDKMLKRPVRTWSAGWLSAIEDASGIPMRVLMRPCERGAVVAGALSAANGSRKRK